MLHECEIGMFAHLDDPERDQIMDGIRSRIATLSDKILEIDPDCSELQ
jgi:hypothetical protein